MEKKTIRSLWLEAVKEVAEEYPETDVPWYITLSGAEAQDIQLLDRRGPPLPNRGTVNSSERPAQGSSGREQQSGNPGPSKEASRSQDKASPISKSSYVAMASFLGLKVMTKRYCRAHIVNLDLNDPLKGYR